jgi:hypothetical protein
MRLRRARPRPSFASLAVLLWAATARASSPDICQADPTCAAHTEAAVARAQANDYHGALAAFTAAYKTQPEPRLLVNIGRCLFHLKRFHESIENYRRFQKAPNFRAEASLRQTCGEYVAESKSAIAAARAQNVGYLVLSVGGPGARVSIDDFEIGQAPFSHTVELKAGRHKVEVRGERPTMSEITIDAGKELSWSFGTLDPTAAQTAAPRGRLPRPRWRIYGGVAAIAVGVLMIGLGAGALSVNGECSMLGESGQCLSAVSEDGTRQAQVYDSLGMGVGLIVPGALLGAAGVTLIAWPGPERATTSQSGSAGAAIGISF